MNRIKIGLIAFSLMIPPVLAAASPVGQQNASLQDATRIGRWCDSAIKSMPDLDYIIELWRLQDGTYQRRQLFTKEKSDDVDVNINSANKINKTWFIQDDYGEYVRVGADGSLHLYDRLGFIRKAMPVGTSTKPENCRTGTSR
ncbi:MAG: hypothetical protein COA60_004090 [Robiginitomaculum sp.]|nr:hypothetical protein [Robiginitomaculum sp.]